MNAYELLRRNGEGSGVWVCGECDEVHASATCGRMPSSEGNREQAERCCEPEKCDHCGEVIGKRNHCFDNPHWWDCPTNPPAPICDALSNLATEDDE